MDFRVRNWKKDSNQDREDKVKSYNKIRKVNEKGKGKTTEKGKAAQAFFSM